MRLDLKGCINLYYLFQSTHPRGVRPALPRQGQGGEAISIHAPTWGATQSCAANGSFALFQSTHPRGVRHKVITDVNVMHLFQSTHPRGVRPDNYPTGTTVNQFQSTHPRGVRRTAGMEQVPDDLIFQSTHPRGVRQSCWLSNSSFRHFNPRTHVGCDCDVLFQGAKPIEFQSTHPRGVRPPLSNSQGLWRYFNPRTHVGCDLIGFIAEYSLAYFNPRTHVGCDC